jgi:small subunit ribosomal protein S1
MSHPEQVDTSAEEQVMSSEDTSFGDILSQFEQEQQQDAADVPGHPLEGTIVTISEDLVFVDIGRKTEGVLPVSALRDETGQVSANPGDTIPVTVRGRNAEGYYELSTLRVERPKDWSGLQAAFDEGRVIGGVVTEVIKGGLRVDIGERAFMPASRSGARDVSEMESLVGQEIRCKITKLDIEKEDVVVDRRAVLEQEERERRDTAFAALSEGQVVTGAVKTILDFGAFIDLGGVDGLLHVADISWTRINKPADVLKVGDSVQVKILKINPDTRKVSLGMKQLQPDPWSVAAEQFQPGNRVRGTVARLTDFGAFVNLAPGIDGLVHVSEMSWSKKHRKPSDVVSVGDAVEVVVLGVNPGEKRISLGLKQALGDPWEEAQKKYPVGSTVEATVSNLANFGAFVDLGDGIEGMIHVGDITREKRIDHPKDVLKVGTSVKAQVQEFDRERRRIRLSMKALEPTQMDKYIAEHQVGEVLTGRIVEIKGDRAKIEVEEGIFATCRLAPQTTSETDEVPKISGAESKGRVDISAATALLAARWKQGSGGGAAEAQDDKNALRAGQVRKFKISQLDSEGKRIGLELES